MPVDKLRKRAENMKYRYGITLSEYDVMFERQGGMCAICRTDLTNVRSHIDHCHTSKEVRGILCHNCNMLLGHARDDREVLLAAIKYLDDSCKGE